MYEFIITFINSVIAEYSANTIIEHYTTDENTILETFVTDYYIKLDNIITFNERYKQALDLMLLAITDKKGLNKY